MSARDPAEAYLDLLKRALTASVYDESAWIYHTPQRPKWPGIGGGMAQFATDLARYFVVLALRRRSVIAAKVRPFDPEIRREGRDWPCFGYTMTGHKRLDNVQQCVQKVLDDDVPGDFLEAGVWRGGMTIFMRAMLAIGGVTDRKVWVADSFEGLPVPKNADDGADFSELDILKVSLADVKANFARFDLLDDQVGFLPGWFEDTLPNAPIDRLAILRLDGDMYSSTMDTLTNLYDKVSPGGFVIVDDYHSWGSCHRAVHDFLDGRSLSPEIISVDWAAAYWRV